MKVGLAIGVRQEGEELCNALVFLGALAAHHPQRGAADDGILRCALDVGEIRHRHGVVGELGVGLDVGIERRGGHEHRTFTRGEASFAGVGPPRIVEALVLLQVDQGFQQLGFQRGVEFEHGIEAVETVGLAAHRHVVPGGELLDQAPGAPGRGEAAGRVGRMQLLGVGEHFRPGLRRLGDLGLLQRVEIDPQHHARRIERKRQHVALRGRVVTGDRRQIGFGVEFLALLLHQLGNRLDRALGGHHGRGADFEHLHDARGVAGAERRDPGVQHVGVAALEGRDDLVVGLRGVEVIGELDHDIVVRAGHRMPPLDLGHRVSGRRERKRDSDCRGSAEMSVSHQIPPVGPSSSLRVSSAG